MSGMHSDNYELARSSEPQSVKDYSAFTDKQWNTKPDTSGGVYQAQNSIVEFDIGSLFKSDAYSDVSDMYLVLPIVMVACASTAAGVTQVPPTSGASLCTLKNNYQNLIHSMELIIDGKTIHDHQSFLNIYSNFKMLSSMTPSDLKSNCTNFGMSPDLDNHKSMNFRNATAAGNNISGYGITNNRPFDTAASFQQTVQQNQGKGNNAILQRSQRIVDTTTLGKEYNDLFGVNGLLTADQLINEYKPYYKTDGNFMYWFDYSIINLKYMLDAFAKIGLVKSISMRLKMYVNTGAVSVIVAGANTADTSYATFTSSFSNTCPFTVNLLTGDVAAGGFSAATTNITAGLYLARPPSSFSGGGAVSIPITQLTHALTQCTLYHSVVKLDLQSEQAYTNANRAKKIVFEKILYNSSLTVGVGSGINKTITNSVKNPIALVIVPFVSKAGIGNALAAALNFAQYESPWDTAPSTGAPLSITGLSVSLGGNKVNSEVLNYSFQNFLHQVTLAETITSSDIGLNVGLINQEYWESNRVYYMDLARSRDIDKEKNREIYVEGKNNSNVPIDAHFFVVYLEEFTIDVVTGIVSN
jgi:hypothetical protein